MSKINDKHEACAVLVNISIDIRKVVNEDWYDEAEYYESKWREGTGFSLVRVQTVN